MRLLTSELPGLVGRDDALFIFWAGHGNQIKTHDGDLGYLTMNSAFWLWGCLCKPDCWLWHLPSAHHVLD